MRPLNHTRSTRFDSPACQESPKSGGSTLARREWERDGHAQPMTSTWGVLSRAATSDATTARLYEAFETHVVFSQLTFRKSRRLSCGSTHGGAASSQSTRQSECSSTSETKPRSKGPGRPHHCPRSECSSVGRHCFARNSRDARDAGDCLVNRKRKRVHSRTTGQCLVGAVAGDLRTDPHLDADIYVRVTSQPKFCDAHERLGSDSEVAMFKGMARALPFRTTIVPMYLQAERGKP